MDMCVSPCMMFGASTLPLRYIHIYVKSDLLKHFDQDPLYMMKDTLTAIVLIFSNKNFNYSPQVCHCCLTNLDLSVH